MNIIITGASRGIGFELTKFFIRERNNIVIAISRNIEKLEVNIRESGAGSQKSELKNIRTLKLDIAGDDFSQIESLCLELGFIDVLVNNAGTLVNKLFVDIEDYDWRYIYDVNLFGPVRLIRTVAPFMGKNNKGHIVNLSSMGGFQGSKKFPGLSAYSSSKAALANLTECLAVEFKDMNISVNCLALGSVDTEMLQEAFPGYKAPISSSEMAKFIYDFCLYGHKYFNGKILPVALSNP